MSLLLARSSRAVLARSALRFRALSAAVELKGIGQAADLQDVVMDGKTIIKMEASGASVGTHKNLPSLPPKMHIDWDFLMADLDEDAKKEVFQVKAIVERQQREIDLKRSELTGQGVIDWSAWEAKLNSPNAKMLLDGFKTEMENWSFDPSETNKVIDQYRADLKEMVRAPRRARRERRRSKEPLPAPVCSVPSRMTLLCFRQNAEPQCTPVLRRHLRALRRSRSWPLRRRSSRARSPCSRSRRLRLSSAWPT